MDDVIVVGGSYAGLSAALQIARTRRRVRIIDAGLRRNRYASSSHGFLGQDGREPGQIVATARAEVLAYPSATWTEGRAVRAEPTADGFAVELASGERFEARRLVLALGVVDELPDVPGIAERWGRSVFHCPYCHGYELDGGRVGVLATMPMAAHAGVLLPDWGPTTYFTRGLFEPTDEERASMEARGVDIERSPVVAVEGEGHDVRVRLDDGRAPSFAGLFLASRTRIATDLPSQLGCALEEGPLGAFVRTDFMKETSVRGVFACGDMAVGAGSVTIAVGDGARAGVAAHRSLIFD